jgi:hypothetical protein
MTRTILASGAICALAMSAMVGAEAQSPAPAVPTFSRDVAPILIYKQPLKLPQGTKVHATAWYDNSAANKSNPDPTADVWWGDQTFEEMMFTAFTFSLDSKPASSTAGAQK